MGDVCQPGTPAHCTNTPAVTGYRALVQTHSKTKTNEGAIFFEFEFNLQRGWGGGGE